MPPGNSSRGTAGLVAVPERYVAGGACPERSRRNTRGRQEGHVHIRGRSKLFMKYPG
ncbi:MAG: hypothetical protein P8X67_16675 [Syntrophobacterales bacterium]